MRVALMLAVSLLASCDGTSEEFRIYSEVSSDRDEADPYLADDLSMELTLVFSEQDAEALGLDGRRYDYNPYPNASPPAARLTLTTGLLLNAFDGRPPYCFVEDVVIEEADGGRAFVLAPAGTCTEPGSSGRLDARATFES